MLITFAIPREIDGEKYQPDDTADLPDAIAKQLIRDGYARRAAGDDLQQAAAGAAEAAAQHEAALNAVNALDLGGTDAEEPAPPITDSPDPGATGQE